MPASASLHFRALRTAVLVVASAFIFTAAPVPAQAYSVLTHEAIVDTLWMDYMVPVLKQKYPDLTEDDLNKAHAYAYGGCIIQDLGYYPFGSHLFSDLAHYVRSADLIRSLLENAHDANELAFALGATAHYGADVDGHSIAVNRAVPVLYPKLGAKYGKEVTYFQDPKAHMRTEFGFDVLQVARGNYAPKAYHDFIGFSVSKELLDRAYVQTYGLTLKDMFKTLDLSLGTYRWSVGSLLPTVTRAAWQLKKDDISKKDPAMTKRKFLYDLNRASYTKEYGNSFQRPGFGARLLAFITRFIPKVGPFAGLKYRMPTPETEKMFQNSFDSAVTRDQQSMRAIQKGDLNIPNRDLDTGKSVSPGEYVLADETYDKLLKKLAEKKFDAVTPELRNNILAFYAAKKSPDEHGIDAELAALKALQPAAALQ